MKKYINTSNYYLSTTTSKIENETSKNGYFDVADITIDGATLPFNGYYWVDVDFGDADKREIFRIYKREGYRLFYDDRISPNGTSAHIAGASVGLRDFSQLLNSLSTNTDNFGEIEETGDLSIIIRGGVIYDVNNMNAKDGKITLEDTVFDSSYITTNSELYIVLEYDEVDGWNFVIKTELLLVDEGQYPIAKIVVGNNSISEIIDLRGTIINQGNMHKSIYDKHGVNDDAFEMDNMIQSVDGLHMFVTQSQIDLWNSYQQVKQDLLVSGTNIKTINNISVLGTGNIDTNQVSNDAYSSNWSGVNNIAPSKNAVYNKLENVNRDITDLGTSIQSINLDIEDIDYNISDIVSNVDDINNTVQGLSSSMSNKQNKLTAGQNIQINGDTISATDTKYTAGTGLSLNNTTLNNTGVLSVNSQNGNVTVSEFTPSNTGTTGQVLKKTSNGYEWSVEADAVTSVNGQTGAVTVSEFTPGNQGDTGQVLKKTSSGYSWQNESGGGGGGGDYTAGAGINISSQNEISNTGVLSVNGNSGAVTVNDIKTGSTSPSNPTEGMLWYDTTNDVLKTYDGTTWNEVGSGGSSALTTFILNDPEEQKTELYNWCRSFWGGDKVPVIISGDGGACYYWSMGYRDRDIFFNGENVIEIIYEFSGTEVVGIDKFVWWPINAKFYINSDLSNIASVGQDVADWLNNTSQDPTTTAYFDATVFVGDMPYYRVGNTIVDGSNYVVSFYEDGTRIQNGSSQTRTYRSEIRFTFSYTNSTWTYVSEAHSYIQIFAPYMLRTDYDYPTPYTPLYNGSPATKKYVDDNVAYVGSSAPSNPTEGRLWYDTTNDVLKTYDGTNWNEVGGSGELNTKTFYLSSTSDLTTAQAVYDWYLAGKNPIVVYNNIAFTLKNKTSTAIQFICFYQSAVVNNSTTKIYNRTLSFIINDTTVSSISYDNQNVDSLGILDTGRNYSTPYTPLYNGSPATKKYVDDSISVVSGDSGVTYTIKVSNSDPTSGTASNIITLVP